MPQDMFPVSYKDPAYDALDAQTTASLSLPPGLLSGVRLRGEKTDHGKVSSAGAITPYQFTPATRKLILGKYDLDVTASPEAASRGAGLLLKEGLDRNNGDPSAAVGEYIGGTDRKNWGPITDAYIKRVTGGLEVNQEQASGPSTFDKVKAGMTAPTPSAIANVYAAYQAGQMPKSDAAQFEADVKAGRVMLPNGASLKSSGASSPNQLPMGVIEAYRAGKIPEADAAQLKADLASGLVTLPAGATLDAADQIPGQAVQAPVATAPPAPVNQGGLVNTLVGGGEAGLQLATGATGGALGMAGGTIKGVAGAIMDGTLGTDQGANNVEQSAAAGANALTYQPRTAAGQAMGGAVGDAMQALIPVAPLGAEMGALAKGAAPVKAAVKDASAAAIDTARQAAPKIRDAVHGALADSSAKVKAAFGIEPAPPKSGASIGAAGADVAEARREIARSQPIPMDLTEGQASRSQEQLRFENETAKDGIGQPLRERHADQNEQLPQNFEARIDETGSQHGGEPMATGKAVDEALRTGAAREKTKYRTLYQEATKAGELEEPVSLQGVIDHLNEAEPESATAPLLTTARRLAVKLGIAEEKDGKLVAPSEPQPKTSNPFGSLAPGAKPESGPAAGVTLKNAETFRQAINRSTDYEATNIRQATILKGLIDDATDGKGGDLYREARKARQRYAQLYEDNLVVSNLLKNKRGTADRQVALEKIVDRALSGSTSRADLSALRRTLHVSGGEEGIQAWKELRAATVRHLMESGLKSSGSDIRGNTIFSAAGLNTAIRNLDKGGKLDFILSKQGAQHMRDLNELAQVVKTVPAGTVNTSNTGSVLVAAIAEAGVMGSLTGLPIPVRASLKAIASHVRDQKVKARINVALGKMPKSGAPMPPPIRSAPAPHVH